MSLNRAQIIIIGAVILLVLVLGGLFIFGGRDKTEKPPEIQLIIWGVEPRDAFYDSLNNYRAFRTNVRVDYEEISPANYESELLNALAAEQGPDVLMFKNTWLPKHYKKIAPVGDSQFNLAQLQQFFPMVAEQDFAPDGLIYALPLYIDTLALYYNTDIFNTAGIAVPPATWLDFQNLVPKLRQVDKQKNITRAAAAIGGSAKTVDAAGDILSLLMLQTGAEMTDKDFTRATFGEFVGDIRPGEIALDFYTKFADIGSAFYTWNDNQEFSLDSFAAGNTATMFSYLYQKNYLQNKNPFLKFKILPMLQPSLGDAAVNYASYWGLAVSKKSLVPEWAWDMIVFLATDEAAAESFLKKTSHPPALRSLIQKHLNEPELGIFAKQALSARSWPQIDERSVANIFSQMIEAVNSRQLESRNALDQAQAQITDLIRLRNPQ